MTTPTVAKCRPGHWRSRQRCSVQGYYEVSEGLGSCASECAVYWVQWGVYGCGGGEGWRFGAGAADGVRLSVAIRSLYLLICFRVGILHSRLSGSGQRKLSRPMSTANHSSFRPPPRPARLRSALLVHGLRQVDFLLSTRLQHLRGPSTKTRLDAMYR